MEKLGFISILYIALSYLAGAVFFAGLAKKIIGYAVTPSPLKIPTTPHPTSASGVFRKNLFILSTFSPLFRANKWIWLGGYALHIILLLVLLRHLRYFMEPVGLLVSFFQPFGTYAGLLMPLPLIFLLGLRRTIDRIKYITSGADIFALLLLLLIAISGISLRFLSHGDVVAVKEFIMGLIYFSPVNFPAHPPFVLHYTTVLILAFYFPFSKLIHAGGFFFSPTRTQIENVRESRHVNPWAAMKGDG